MATLLGIQQRTFNGYLSQGRQDNLLALLPKILQEYPQISREWLYFDEGEMYGGGEPKTPPTPHADAALLREEVRRLQNRLLELHEELHAAKDKIIAMHEAEGKTRGRHAHGFDSAALFMPDGSE